MHCVIYKNLHASDGRSGAEVAAMGIASAFSGNKVYWLCVSGGKKDSAENTG